MPPGSDQRRRPDLTVVMNGHREGSLALKTLRSVVRASDAALARGVLCELLVVLDRPDEATVGCFEASRELVDRIDVVDLGDPALARNHGARAASADLVAFIDCDDLVSGTWFHAAVAARRGLDPSAPVALHPEWNVVFDAMHVLSRHVEPADPSWRAENLVEHNYWTAPVVVDRAVMLATPYRAHPEGCGFGFEDWDWNLRTLAKGVAHRVVAGAAVYIRRKQSGSRMLREIGASAIVRPSAGFDWIVDQVSAASSGKARAGAPVPSDADYLARAFLDPAFVGDMLAVSTIEPLLDPSAERVRAFVPWDWSRVFSPLGRVFAQIVVELPGRPEHAVVFAADPAGTVGAHARAVYEGIAGQGSSALLIGVDARGAAWRVSWACGGERSDRDIDVSEVDDWRRPLLLARLLLHRPARVVHFIGAGMVSEVLARHGAALASESRLLVEDS